MSGPAGPKRLDRIRGIGSGCVFFGPFGGLWLFSGANSTGFGTPPVLAALGAGCLGIVALGIRLARSAKGPPSPGRARVMRGFLWINVAQWAAIGAAVVVLVRADEAVDLPAAISVIVALHFLPLARLFGHSLYVATAVGLLAVDGLAFWRGGDAGAVTALLGTGAVLWATALVQLARGYSLRRAAA